jgi:ABC-type branched-subunit amino acid transport system permease subunit
VSLVGAASTIYGILLILFVIFMPRRIWGLFEKVRSGTRSAVPPLPTSKG